MELDTDYSLDECVTRLEHAHEGRRGWDQPMFVVRILNADAMQVEFNMLIGHGLVQSWFVGKITCSSSELSLVTGQVGISPEIIMLLGMLLIIPIGALLVTQAFPAFFLGAGIYLVGGIFLWHSAVQMRDELIVILEETL